MYDNHTCSHVGSALEPLEGYSDLGQCGYVRFGLRDYDPMTWRFTAKDPLGYAAGDDDL